MYSADSPFVALILSYLKALAESAGTVTDEQDQGIVDAIAELSREDQLHLATELRDNSNYAVAWDMLKRAEPGLSDMTGRAS